MDSAQIVIALLSTGSLAAIAGAIVTGVFNRKRLGADATEIITRAASSVVERIEDENERLRKEIAELQADRAILREMIEDHTKVLQLHAAWDALAVAKLREHDILDLPDPPPMYHPKATPSQVRATLEG